MSTPIVNPPQSAILGMHTIKERAIVENGQVIAAPMMYIALSYDHRIIDGKDAVLFLVDIKNQLENPHRMRSEEHTSELQSLIAISYAVFCLIKKTFNIHLIATRHATEQLCTSTT